MANECCAHSIVKHTKVHVGGGVTKDAWACCDCAMRFDPAPHLPTFAPEPSHLHLKLDKLRAEVAVLRDALIRMRDSTHTSAAVLRGMADFELQKAARRGEHMSVSDVSQLPALDAVLYDRPAGRNIVGHAIDTINSLRAEVAAQLEQMMRDVDRAEKAEADADRLLELLSDIRAQGRITGDIAKRLIAALDGEGS